MVIFCGCDVVNVLLMMIFGWVINGVVNVCCDFVLMGGVFEVVSSVVLVV